MYACTGRSPIPREVSFYKQLTEWLNSDGLWWEIAGFAEQGILSVAIDRGESSRRDFQTSRMRAGQASDAASALHRSQDGGRAETG